MRSFLLDDTSPPFPMSMTLISRKKYLNSLKTVTQITYIEVISITIQQICNQFDLKVLPFTCDCFAKWTLCPFTVFDKYNNKENWLRRASCLGKGFLQNPLALADPKVLQVDIVRFEHFIPKGEFAPGRRYVLKSFTEKIAMSENWIKRNKRR